MQQIFSESLAFVRRNIDNNNDYNDNGDVSKCDQVKNVIVYTFITIWPRPLGLLQLIPIT